MKSRITILTIVAGLAAALVFVAHARSAHADEQAWQTDFKAALAQAKAEKKYLLVDFTGSDWCYWCKKLHREVFNKEPFKAEAPKQYVLVELDFPLHKKLSPELTKQNDELRDKYEIDGFPTVLIMDAEGRVIARTEYLEGGPKNYLQHLAEFDAIYKNVAALQAKLEAVQGLDRAKLLDELVEGYKKLGNESKQVAEWSKEILALDVDNKAGLKVKYEFLMKIEQAQKLAKAHEAAEARELLDNALAVEGIPAEMRQDGFRAKADICRMQHKFGDMLAALKDAKAAAPQSPEAKRLDTYIEQATKIAAAQETVNKLQPELAKSEGLDRAKLLDELVEAQEKLPMDNAKDIEQLSQEIIALDADGKAGLKTKYEVKMALADAAKLLGAGKMDEASAALDKALETPGISAEDKQQAMFLKARISLSHKDEKEGLAWLNKALEAAPTSEAATMIKERIADLDPTQKPAEKDDE